jgi:site-specific recombinase XerD
MSYRERTIEVGRRFLDPGALAPSVDAFGAYLAALGHTALTVADSLRSACHFGQWLTLEELPPDQVDDRVVARFAVHRCRCPGGRQQGSVSRRYAARVERFVRFCQQRGTIPATVPEHGDAVPPCLASFRDHLLHQRGLAPSTVGRYTRLVAALLPALGNDPSGYTAGTVRQVALDAAGTTSRAQAKTVVTALRVYLRFLAARGECRPGLDYAVPPIPQWRLSALPRYLPPGDVERVIASCDTATPQGLRDRAILLLLARLGLRAGDVFDLRIGDLDWTAATLRVRGKGRRDIRLPLPQEAGDALLAYLTQVRPRTAEPRVFLRSCAPHRPLAKSGTISSIVRLALDRAGISSPPSRGANLLRHSAATALLRAGATLDAVSALLRHRSLDTTAYYAKVDLPMLRRVVQPWPEGGPC